MGTVLQPLIARETSHFPDKGQVTVRCYGLYANAYRGKVRKERLEAFPLRITGEELRRFPSKGWAVMIRTVYEVDPLIYRRFGGRMKVIPFRIFNILTGSRSRVFIGKYPYKAYIITMTRGSEDRLDFDSVYRSYHKKVRSYLGKLISDLEAEDLTQEVFEKIHRRLRSLNDPSKLSSWIFTIALNTARDKKRQARIREPDTDRLTLISSDPERPLIDQIADLDHQTPDERYVRKEMAECYLGFVRKLPPRYYEVYACSEFEELTDSEISKKLALPLNTIKMRLHRARQMLYEELRAHCQCYHSKNGELLGHRKE